jgi:hypothetical protein
MFSETTKIQRTVMGVTAVIAGIFMMYFAPEQGMQTLKIALENVMERLIPFDPDFYPAVPVGWCFFNCNCLEGLSRRTLGKKCHARLFCYSCRCGNDNATSLDGFSSI